MIKAVIDTNVIVSAYITKNLEAATSKVLEAVMQCKLTNATRQSKATALARNRYICEIADEIYFSGVTEKSSLFELKKEYENLKCRV